MVVIQVRRGSESIYAKTSFDDASWTCYKLMKRQFSATVPLSLRLYPQGLEIEKKKDICERLMPHMPAHKRQFWQLLPESDTISDERRPNSRRAPVARRATL